MQIDVLASEPKIVMVLHGKPTFRSAAYSFRKAECHFWGDTARTLEDTAERGSSNVKLDRKFAATDAIGLQIDFSDEFTRMWRVLHSH